MTKDSDEAFETPKVRGPRHRRDRSLRDWVGGPDGATNGDVYKPKLKLRDDYPIEYSCAEAVEGRGATLNEVWFRYDYELTLDESSKDFDPTETRRAFEWSVLWNVGIELGLYNCSIDMQQPAPSARLLQLQQEQRFLGAATTPASTNSPSALTQVVALGNDAEDQVNMQAKSCFSQDTACRPMKGIMNALYTGDERDAENMVLGLVQKVMATPVVRVKGVSQVQYIGDRDEYAKSIPPVLTTTNGSTNDANDSHARTFGMAIGIAVGTACVIGLVVGMLVARVVRKRGEKRRESETKVSVTSIEIMELDDEKNDADKEESNVVIVSSMEEGTLDTDAGSVKPEEPQPAHGIVPAPVKQPPQQSQSLPSKRRRRRKKKKRKKNRMGLTRSNSVNSMDTITEENEEDEDSDCYDGSDCESDYSTDNEDQDFQMKRTMSTSSLTSEPSFPLELVVESPRIKKLPPPPV